ncbi:MAG TPA: T9SS type A sorting domain-containing protein [Bacteroidia bacterium]|nr:T9SS type A sorting domain-containing protein [Bacteroidia bacterium]
MRSFKLLLFVNCMTLFGMVPFSNGQTTLLWDTVYALPQPYCIGVLNDVINDNSGNVYTCGYMQGHGTCWGATPFVGRLLKTDSNGTILWEGVQDFYIGPLQYYVGSWGLAFDADSNIYMFSGYGPNSSSAIDQLLISKWDTSGNMIWEHNYSTYTGFNTADDKTIRLRSDGKFYLKGEGNKPLTIDTSGALTKLTVFGYSYSKTDLDSLDNLYSIAIYNSTFDRYFQKINSNGTLQFSLPNINSIQYTDLKVIDVNHIAVYGYSQVIPSTYYLTVFDSVGSLIWQQAVPPTNQLISNTFGEIWTVDQFFPTVELSKFDLNGNLLFTKSYPLPLSSTASGITNVNIKQDEQANLYISGLASGSFNFAVLMKITNNGNLAFYHQYDYSPVVANQWEGVNGLSLDREGNIYLASDLTTFPVVNDYQLLIKYSKPPAVVWPGDADYNLNADNYDILELGLNYGITGTTRSNASLNWVAQPSAEWNSFSPSSINSKHADCNGDGIVSHSDTAAVSLNYGQSHPFRLMQPNSNSSATGPDLYFDFPSGSVTPGGTATIPVKLGTQSNPATDFYGIAYTIDYDENKIDPNSISVSYSGSWLGQYPSAINFAKNFPTTGQLDLAQVSALHNNITGYGTIAEISFQLKPTAAGTINFAFNNTYAINNSSDNLPVNTLPYGLTTGLTENPPINPISIYFNAAEDLIYVYTTTNPNEKREVAVFNLVGQQLIHSATSNNSLALDASSLASGTYIVQVSGLNNKTARLKFVITR